MIFLKKIFSALIAAVFVLSVTLVAAGCSKSAGSNDKTDIQPTTAASAKDNSAADSTAGTTPTQQPSAAAQTTQAAQANGYNDAVKNIALSYYGASESNGDSVTLVNTVTAPNGKTYHLVSVSTSYGTSQLYVSDDAIEVYEPSVFNAQFYGGNDPVSDGGNAGNNDNNNGDNGNNGNNADNGNNGGSDDASYNTPVPYDGRGPDGAEP